MSSVPQPPFRVRTIYSWSGTQEDDLGFIEGDIIEVDDLGDGNWWHGRLKRNKMTGVFPSNYVELIKSDFQNFSASVRNGFQNDNETSSSRNSFNQSQIPHSQSHYSKLNQSQRPSNNNSNEDLQFSFQSSRNYYSDVIQNDAYAPQSPYQSYSKSQSRRLQSPAHRDRDIHYNLPHSQSVPGRLEEQNHYKQSSRPQSKLNHSADCVNVPAPPQHSIPVKSHSVANLRSQNYQYSPEREQHYDDLNNSRSTNSSNVFSYSNGSYFHSSQSSHNSSFAMSDFSATSAGSYARHKYEEQQNMKTSASGNNLLIDEKKVKNSTGLLRKFFSVKDAPPLPTVDTLNDKVGTLTVEEKQMNSWIEFKTDLNRANSLSSKERALREKRVRENEGYIIFEPHKQLSTINNNEVYQNETKLQLTTINLTHVDNYIRNLKTTSKIMSPEAFIANELGMKYSSKLEYIRALFILCTEHFKIIDPRTVSEQDETNISRMFQTKTATSQGLSFLFHYLSKMMGLKSELVAGSLKTPQSIIRHHWNSVLINGEWRFVDCGLGNQTHPIYELLSHQSLDEDLRNESFYFLTEPLNLIYTHIPDKYELQHIVPPIDSMAALALPPCFPSFFKNDLKIHKFSNALTRLNDYEIFEIDLKVPNDIEINASVISKTTVVNTLSQIYWKHNERYVKIKGHLPDNSTTGFINIYSGPKGLQKSLQNIHSLSLVVPITHEGNYRPLDFVIRYPTIPSLANDLYIKQPQNKNLAYGADYVFQVQQHPSNGQTRTSNIVRPKIALQSPSGRITKFNKKDPNAPFGAWELPVKCNETGVWRGLVSVDNGTSLCVFSEWICS